MCVCVGGGVEEYVLPVIFAGAVLGSTRYSMQYEHRKVLFPVACMTYIMLAINIYVLLFNYLGVCIHCARNRRGRSHEKEIKKLRILLKDLVSRLCYLHEWCSGSPPLLCWHAPPRSLLFICFCKEPPRRSRTVTSRQKQQLQRNFV